VRVVNASPLIVLSKLGRLDLLLEPRPDIEVVVPQAVLDEVMRGEPDDPAVSLVPKAVADWMRVIPTPPVHASLQVGVLDPGEIAVLSVALNHPGWEAVLDDHFARREATRLGIPCSWGSRASAPSVWSRLVTGSESSRPSPTLCKPSETRVCRSRMGFSASPWIKPGSEAPQSGLENKDGD